MSPSASPIMPADYLATALYLIRKHSIRNRDLSAGDLGLRPLDWNVWANALCGRKKKAAEAPRANWASHWARQIIDARHVKTVENVYPVLQQATETLEDRTSSFLPPFSHAVGQAKAKGKRKSKGRSAQAPLQAAGIVINKPSLKNIAATVPTAMLTLPTLSDYRGHGWPDYIKAGWSFLQMGALDGIKNWVLDLRGNEGRSLEPVILAASPFFRGKHILFAGEADGSHPVVFQISQVNKLFHDLGMIRLPAAPAKVPASAPLAVLIDKKTAAAAEAVCLALRTRPFTRFFGETTKGQTLFNRETGPMILDDGARLAVAAAFMQDGQKQGRGGPISPHDATRPKEAPVAAAAWLANFG